MTKKVLVVDDEEDMLWMLQRNLNKGMPDVEILSARSGEEALAVLSDTTVELVITDINMPGMNGLDLLIEINNRYPDTGVIIMTAYPSSAYEREAMMSGSLRFIEKPFDIKDMRDIVKSVLKTSDGFQGTINGIDLMDIIQFNGLSQATAALKVTTAHQEGMLFFKNGAVVHAMCDQASGEEAFFKIITFNDGTLQNIRGVEPPIISINKSLESLLFEAAVRNDEGTARQEDSDDERSPVATLEDLDTGDIIAPLEDETEDAMTDFADEGLPGTISDLEPETDTATIANEHRVAEAPLPSDAQPSIVENQPVQPAAPRDEQTSTPEEDNEMTNIQKILAEFTNIEGVHTACLVGRDGFLLDSIARSGIDAEMIGAIASSGFGSAESMGNQLGQGDLNMTMLEYTDGPVMFAPVGSEAFLVIVADKDTNLGWIRLTIKKNSKVIEKAANL
jgi:predicted regulator of Ras-like GTPase activity (Roadblock/LC7/MglB family)/DNA-binding response OmpR family regulator